MGRRCCIFCFLNVIYTVLKPFFQSGNIFGCTYGRTYLEILYSSLREKVHRHNFFVEADDAAFTQLHLYLAFVVLYKLIDIEHFIDNVFYALLACLFVIFVSGKHLFGFVLHSFFDKTIDIAVASVIRILGVIFVTLGSQANLGYIVIVLSAFSFYHIPCLCLHMDLLKVDSIAKCLYHAIEVLLQNLGNLVHLSIECTRFFFYSYILHSWLIEEDDMAKRI